MLTEQEILSGKGTRVESRSKGTQEHCSASWLAVSDFMVMGLVSGLSLADHSDSESFLVVHTLFSQDGCYREGFWEVDRQVVFPLDLFRTLPAGGWLITSLFLIRISCHKTTHADGYYGAWPGWAVSISVLPLTGSFLNFFTIITLYMLVWKYTLKRNGDTAQWTGWQEFHNLDTRNSCKNFNLEKIQWAWRRW